MTANTDPTFLKKASLQGRVIWALTMREVVTRYGREGLGAFWLLAEPAMFIIGVMAVLSHLDNFSTYSVAEYLAISYPTLLLWRNGTSRLTKALEVNRALLHHQPIRPIDLLYARILLEFAGAGGAFVLLLLMFIQLGICHWPANPLTMTLGYLLVVWFSFSFVLIMSALSELSETIERISHIILYLMLPFSGVFVPLFSVPQHYRSLLTYFPLVDAIEYMHHGYYGPRMMTYYALPYTLGALLLMTLFAYSLTTLAIKRFQLTQ
jgi:capsular polysaccharide transport system permease protein